MTWHPDIPEDYRNQIVTGDARELAERLPDASVDLIFTDPVYDRIEDYAWLAETAARVLKPDRACLAFSSVRFLPETIDAMCAALSYRWQFIEYRTNEVKHRPAAGGKCLYAPLLWFDKGKKRPSFVLDVRAIAVFSSSSNHEWSKPPLTVTYYLNAFTKPGDIVLDPFVGGGTTAVAAKQSGRNFIASEVDPARAARARERVELTQAMHPVLLESQLELAL
jgi:site-specific DNA-methyltransferase (adenine-specific)